MSLNPGTKLGPYEILAPLGAGGMGEVYKAKDLKLGRDVAIKVLPDLFTDVPERLARFQREAEVLASLKPSQHRPDPWPRGKRRYSCAGAGVGRRADAG